MPAMLFLLIIWGDVSIEKRGPYTCEPARDKAARSFRWTEGDEHGIHWLDIYDNGDVEVGDYSGGFFDQDLSEDEKSKRVAAAEATKGIWKDLSEEE